MSHVRVMSFNIRGSSFVEDGVNAWKNRAGLNVATIRRYAPDLIGFQEVHQENLATYQDHLSDYRWHRGPEVDWRGSGHYNVVFWRADLFTLVESGGFWLGEDPVRQIKSWDAALVRGATWVRLALVDRGLELYHFNAHLDHVGTEARVEGCRLLLGRVEQLENANLPVILTGDFNWSAPSAGSDVNVTDNAGPYEILTEGGFLDTYLVAHQRDDGPPNTFHGFEGDAFVPWDAGSTVRIDWILLRDSLQQFDVCSAAIVRDRRGRVYPSDHYPLLTDLGFGGAA